MKEFAGNGKIRVLFFSQRFPFPMDTGGKIRTGKLLEALRKKFCITLISNVEKPKDDPYLDQVQHVCDEFHGVPWKEVKKYSPRFYWKVFLRSFSSYPITVINDYSPELAGKIREVVAQGQFDLLICDFLQPSLNFQGLNGYPTVLFQHNVESEIVKRHYLVASNPVSKLFWKIQWKKMCDFEKKTCEKFTGVITVSEHDKNLLENRCQLKNVSAIPTGVDTQYFTPGSDTCLANSLVFTGSLDWLPNEDAIVFFAEEILGIIKQRIPNITFTVVGRNPSHFLLNKVKSHKEITIVGRVEDIRPYVSSHLVYVIPLRIGGGTRIKAYEAMAMGKAVVSTTIGMEGLPVTNGEHVILADGAQDFAHAVVTLLENSGAREKLEQSARQFVQEECGWERAADAFHSICLSVLQPA